MVLQQGAQTAVATPLSRARRGGNSVARASAERHSGRVRSAGSSRRHVLGEERGDVDARQYAALPAGQPAAGSGVVTRSVESAPHGSCPGRPLRARDPLSRGPPTRRIGRVARHRLAKPWSGETPRTFDPCILRRRRTPAESEEASGRGRGKLRPRSRETPAEAPPARRKPGRQAGPGRKALAESGSLGRRRRTCPEGRTPTGARTHPARRRPRGRSPAGQACPGKRAAPAETEGPAGRALRAAGAPVPPRSRRRRSTSSPRRRPPSGTRGRWPWPRRGRTR